MNVARKTKARMRTVSSVIDASYQGRRNRDMFRDVRSYCQFIGYPRSGHSLVGSLLDAHPNAVIANELDALRYLKVPSIGREGLFWMILDRDREFTEKGRRWTGYFYSVPNQWQGRFDTLTVIGDKKGDRSTVRLGDDPGLLRRLRETVRAEVRFVHVVRNPFDNIATVSRRGAGVQQATDTGKDRTLEGAADTYFSLCRTNAGLRERAAGAVFDLRHEDLIADPQGSLAALCRFMGMEPSEDYLRDCASIVNPSPHRSRTEVTWEPGLVERIQEQMTAFDFLDGYSFDD